MRPDILQQESQGGSREKQEFAYPFHQMNKEDEEEERDE